MSPEATYLLQALGTVVVFGGALAVVLWGARKLGVQAPRGRLEILARQPLDGRRAIYLVRVGKRVLIVGASDAALTRLGSVSVDELREEEAKLSATEDPPRARFRDVLSRALGRPPSDER